MPLTKLPVLGPNIPRRPHALFRPLMAFILGLSGWRVQGNLPNESKMVLIGAPHTSNVDGFVAVAIILGVGLRLSLMGKHTLFKRPFGGLMRWLGVVPINRTASMGMVEQTIEAFNRRDAFVLALAPEGTRTEGARWRTGFYHIAVGANVPIVPIVFNLAERILSIEPAVWPSGDAAADLAAIHRSYETIYNSLGRDTLRSEL